MKVLVTGGGTGGHIYPAIAIANKIKEEMKDTEILFVGTKRGLETQLVPKAGYRLETIRVRGFKRSLSFDTVRSIKDLFLGLGDAVKIIKKFQPDLVIGTGGYVCGPIVFIASLLNIKTVIHEQNVIPGVTNKILSKFVKKVFTSFEESGKYFDNSKKIMVTGNPVRKEFIHINKEQCRRDLGINDHTLVVMSFGGSRGAKKINDTMIEVLEKLNGNKNVHMIHVTGKEHYPTTLRTFDEKNFKIEENIKIKEYVHDMPKVMGACDLVICRSGAITLAEVTTMGLPSILIPSPYVTNNHQEYNAKVLEKEGAAILIKEKDLKAQSILELLDIFLREPNQLKRMGDNSKKLSKPNATDMIYNNIQSLIYS